MSRSKPRTAARARFERGPLPAARTPLGDAPEHADFGSIQSGPERFIDNPGDRELFAATRAMVLAARLWRKLTNDRVKPLGQTMARWETLYYVALLGERLPQSELAERLGVEGPTLVRMLDRLAKDGLIERRQSGSDRRVTHNRITSAGLETVERIMDHTNLVRAEILSPIDEGRLRTCIEVLLEIIERVELARDPNTSP